MTKTRQVPRPDRVRINQPTNYSGTKLMRRHKCRLHDYHYYGENWVDKTTGQEFLKGYYDEEGNRYDALILEKDGVKTSHFDCNYCGTATDETWTEGAIPHCPNCGALLIESDANIITDSIDNSMITEEYKELAEETSALSSGKNKVGCIVAAMVLFVPMITFFGVVFSIAMGFLGGNSNNPHYDQEYINQIDNNDPVISNNLELFGESFYVESIGRTVEFDYENGYYYDATSDCYFIYNTDSEPAVWQYWYEGISSDYGDYGWMEYELNEDTWYIESDYDNWIVLPSKYNTSRLWYMTGTQAGTSYTDDYNLVGMGEYIKVDSESTECYWDANHGAYNVSAHGCYIYVNFDAAPPVVQYWVDGISDNYCHDTYGGWLEYDYEQELWYVEDGNGTWIVLPDDESASLWHAQDHVTGAAGSVVMVK